MIGLRGVRRRFGAFVLDVSLEVAQGEYAVLLGPSGCGKSLLLGTVAGLHAPDAGAVLLADRDVAGEPPERRGVGFVFQKASLFPHLTVEQNIAFGLAVRGVPRQRRRERVHELVALLGIERILDRPVPSLSGGEAQKVAIARALAPEPRVLLLDEPLSLVDHNARLELQDTLARLHRELGFTALHVTHNREEARALGRRLAVMLGGRLVQMGPTEEVLAHPRCLFVARFLGLREAPLPENPGCDERCLGGTGECNRPWEEQREAQS